MKQVWIRYPALFYGLTLFLGTLFALASPLAILPLFLLMNKENVFKGALIFLIPMVYLYHVYIFPPSDTVVSGKFYIQSIQESRSITKGWNYRGLLKTPTGSLACLIHSKTRYLANQIYQIHGKAYSESGYFYLIKEAEWMALYKTCSLVEMRYQAKKWVRSYIKRHIKNRRSAQFLTGMITGSLEDPMLIQEFSHLGLSHIMAISGFHFALLTLFIHLLLHLFLPPKGEACLLIFILTIYLLFIGESPSIQRAWIVTLLFLIGQIFERSSQPLNSLGVALFIVIFLNPLSAITLSFQLSFLATAGILVLYQPLNQLLQLWIPKISLKEALAHRLIWQHFYFLAALIREALTLTLSVHLALLPLLLYHFHTFSLNSLIYNLFFPFCASLALFLFIISILTGGLLHPLNNWYCGWLLKLTESPPILFKTFFLEKISPELCTIYMSVLFSLAIYWTYRPQKKTEM
ncbi:MAG: ComEC/Rec2 family competence protein [Chlamydiales bacterium]